VRQPVLRRVGLLVLPLPLLVLLRRRPARL
jgi:hypothetical protein